MLGESEENWGLSEMQCFEQALAAFKKRKRLNFAEVKCKFEIVKLLMSPAVPEEFSTP